MIQPSRAIHQRETLRQRNVEPPFIRSSTFRNDFVCPVAPPVRQFSCYGLHDEHRESGPMNLKKLIQKPDAVSGVQFVDGKRGNYCRMRRWPKCFEINFPGCSMYSEVLVVPPTFLQCPGININTKHTG